MHLLNHQQMITDRYPDASLKIGEYFDNDLYKSPINEIYNHKQAPDANISIKSSSEVSSCSKLSLILRKTHLS